MINRTPALLLAFTLCLTASLYAEKLAKSELQIETAHGKFLLTDLRLERNRTGWWVLFGNVANSTNRNWRYAKFDVQLLDEGGQPFRARSFSVQDFSKGDTKPLMSITGRSKGVELGLAKGKERVADFNVLFLKDESIYEFAYVLSMLKPVMRARDRKDLSQCHELFLRYMSSWRRRRKA
jgi:hypothetical protein